MKILRNVDFRVIANMGEQSVLNGLTYRFMKYCLSVNIDGGKVILNEITRAIVFLSNKEMENINDIGKYTFLYKYYFLVPEDFDEDAKVEQLKQAFLTPIDDVYLDHPESFTILTTSLCNARCSYCYESGIQNKHHMTPETANKIADYILRVSPNNKTINLHWFGGEPLFNQRVINIIIDKLNKAGKKFTTTFTTNGYLFNKQLLDKVKDSWHISNLQITIDGTENMYNKIKNYIYKDKPSPYKVVLNNIASLINAGIKVTVRMNVDNHNGDDLCELVYELKDRFGINPNFGMYTWPVFENEFYSRTEEQHKEVFEKLFKLDQTILDCGYTLGSVPKPSLDLSLCMADGGKSVTINMDGEIGTCEHFTDSHFFSHIDNPDEKNMEELKKWRLYEPKLDICNDCPLFPKCIRPSQCMEMSKCDVYYKQWRINKDKEGLKTFYKNTSVTKKADDNIWN